MNYATYIGIDTHKLSNSVCALQTSTGQVIEERLSSDPAQLIAWINSNIAQGSLTSPVLCCYESGPTGYKLQRSLEDAGFECIIAASSKLPHRSDRQKTDAIDAKWLAQMALSGAIRPVTVPDEALEALRELVCARGHAARELARAKQRIRSFMLRHSIVYTKTKRLWTKTFVSWAAHLTLPTDALQLIWCDLVEAARAADERKRALDDACASAIASDERLSFIDRCLRALPGIGPVCSLALIAKIGSAERFPSPHAFSSYIGLVPMESSSGQTTRRGGISKTGDGYVRRLLVEAACTSLRQKRLARVEEDVPAPVVFQAKELFRRIRARYEHLRDAGKRVSIIRVALAREIAQKVLVVFRLAEQLFNDRRKAA